MGGSSSSDKTTVIRYAPYIEGYHSDFLATTRARRQLAIDASPYDDYMDLDYSDSFFGLGYTLSNFPSLYDMYGKFMSGFDIEAIWPSIFNDSISLDESNAAVTAEMEIYDDVLSRVDIAEFSRQARTLNIVGSSTFIVGKANIEGKRVKKLSARNAETQFAMLAIMNDRMSDRLNWNKAVIANYSLYIKSYYDVAAQVDTTNYRYTSKDSLWPFTVLDFERAALGAFQRSDWQKEQEIKKRSNLSRVLLVSQQTVNGAMVGSMICPGWGTLIGAATGTQIGVMHHRERQ